MNILDFIRILRRHIVLLVVIPLILAAMVTYMTRKPDLKFDSETTLYTGIATGSSVEMDKAINSLASNTSFDNLINVIKSRETQQEVAIRLLAQHLLLDKADSRYISAKSFSELIKITPAYIKRLVVKKDNLSKQKVQTNVPATENDDADTSSVNKTFSFQTVTDSTRPAWLPASINPGAFEQTVENLTNYMQSSDTNFIYKLLNYSHPHYSISAISTVKAQRIGLSDLVSLKYETDDAAVCQQTLEFFTQVCIKNYRSFKENRSDAVVKYFEFQLKQAAARLTVAEDKLLKFNTDNNIINYYEQSKAVAGVKEQLDLDYNSKKVHLAGVQAAIVRLEEKLGNQEQIQLKSSKIIEQRDQLGALSYKIASIENKDSINYKEIQTLAELKAQAEKLKDEIKGTVGELYKYGNTTDGLPISSVLNDWITNVIDAENSKAGLVVMAQKIIEFQKQYAIYAPAGANLKRIEREISVAEQEFLEILHGLNQAKLKMQDNELSSNLKAIDPPFFPLSPTPTKRSLLIVIGALVGFLIVLISVLMMEYLDDSLNNPDKASKTLNMPLLGIFPKIFLKVQNTNFLFITNRLLEIIIQNIELYTRVSKSDKNTKSLLIFSTLGGEGKSAIAANLAQKLKLQGKKVVVLDFSHETLLKTETTQIGYKETSSQSKHASKTKGKQGKSIIGMILGYPDSRIDFESPFLESAEKRLGTGEYFVYSVNEKFYSAKNYNDILEQNSFDLAFVPDYVLIELPPVLYYPYPVALVTDADLPIMVCRANRVWSKADQVALDVLMKLTEHQTHFILNGVELSVIESVLGDLPKKRSRIRRLLKKLFRLEFFARNHI
jgi:succinoglycan biosynthesis transport protein ExoP